MTKSEFKKLVREIIEDELEEISVTGNVAGYNTPHAFKKSDGTDTDDEPESDFVKRINTGTGYTKIKEGTNRFHQLRKEEGSANQKIGVGIRNIRTQLREIEKFIEWYGKIKTENGLESSDYWKRTQRHLYKIRERLTTISNKLRKL